MDMDFRDECRVRTEHAPCAMDPVPEIQREVAMIVEEDVVEGRLQERRLATIPMNACRPALSSRSVYASSGMRRDGITIGEVRT
jgi:hypothetical protein